MASERLATRVDGVATQLQSLAHDGMQLILRNEKLLDALVKNAFLAFDRVELVIG